MARRIHTPQLHRGEIELTADEAHHARRVLRLENNTTVEIFDDAGQIAVGTLLHRGTSDATVRVEQIGQSPRPGMALTVASAIPKGERADWMIEKLSELGIETFVPLVAERSVVVPQGQNKIERWARIATESAKQSRRPGIMRIGPVTPLSDALQNLAKPAWALCIGGSRMNRRDLPAERLTIFIGPEGGWTDGELSAFATAGVERVGLTDTVLRVETAAIAAAALVLTLAAGSYSSPSQEKAG